MKVKKQQDIFTLKNNIFIALFILIVIIALVDMWMTSCNVIPKDNFVEEAIEQYIEHETGIEVELSP